MGYSKVDRTQAIIVAALTGRIAQSEIPVVADEYRHGSYLRESVARHTDFFERHHVANNHLAISTVRFALCGYGGCLKVEAYDGLLTAEEQKQLRVMHLFRAASDSGRKTYEMRKGLHSLTAEEKVMVWKRSLESRGLVCWAESEIEEAIKLASDPAFVYGRSSHHAGMPHWGFIAEEINQKYHGGARVRTSESVAKTVCNFRKKKKNLASNE